jgi:hypothetical protein
LQKQAQIDGEAGNGIAQRSQSALLLNWHGLRARG